MGFNLNQLELIKKEFTHLSTDYFNTAYFGPSPYRAKQKVANALFKELDPSFFPYHAWIGIPDRIRLKIASLLKLSSDHIALGTSTSDFVSMVANHLPTFKNQKILKVAALNGDYPSCILPWMVAQKYRHDLEFHLLKSPEETKTNLNIEWFEKNLPVDTNVFCLSYVQFDSGRSFPLREISAYLKSRNIFFILDATQALGGINISSDEFQNVDVLCCSLYKWFLGPYGTSFAYFSQNALNLIPHNTGNWIVSSNSRDVTRLTSYTVDTLVGARKFDRGQGPNMLANAALEASLEMLEELGLENISAYNQDLQKFFLSQLNRDKFELVTPVCKDCPSTILSIKTKDNNPSLIESELKHRNIDVSVREGKIRISIHFFNTKKQVEALLDGLS
jgi:cysteine desulfurase/selenocysteine lyase